jgi:hypothetical protein
MLFDLVIKFIQYAMPLLTAMLMFCFGWMLIWCATHQFPHHFIDKMASPNIGLGFLGREKKFTECGLYSMNLQDKNTQEFLVEFQKAYDTGRLFTMSEWNDCWVFDIVRKEVKARNPAWKWNDWSQGMIKGEGHPLINSEWGAYLDHLKGKRKNYGKSTKSDLRVNRHEKYWIKSLG